MTTSCLAVSADEGGVVDASAEGRELAPVFLLLPAASQRQQPLPLRTVSLPSPPDHSRVRPAQVDEHPSLPSYDPVGRVSRLGARAESDVASVVVVERVRQDQRRRVLEDEKQSGSRDGQGESGGAVGLGFRGEW